MSERVREKERSISCPHNDIRLSEVSVVLSMVFMSTRTANSFASSREHPLHIVLVKDGLSSLGAKGDSQEAS